MKQLSFKKYSILGLALLTASAVSALLLPSKASASGAIKAANGNIVNADDGGPTCRAVIETATCNNTASQGANTPDSSTSHVPGGTSGTDPLNGTNTTAGFGN